MKTHEFEVYQNDFLHRKLGLKRKDTIEQQLKDAGFSKNQAAKEAANSPPTEK